MPAQFRRFCRAGAGRRYLLPSNDRLPVADTADPESGLRMPGLVGDFLPWGNRCWRGTNGSVVTWAHLFEGAEFEGAEFRGSWIRGHYCNARS